jgi:hypothetical protein
MRQMTSDTYCAVVTSIKLRNTTKRITPLLKLQKIHVWMCIFFTVSWIPVARCKRAKMMLLKCRVLCTLKPSWPGCRLVATAPPSTRLETRARPEEPRTRQEGPRARPFEEIPSPPRYPLLGHSYLFRKEKAWPCSMYLTVCFLYRILNTFCHSIL